MNTELTTDNARDGECLHDTAEQAERRHAAAAMLGRAGGKSRSEAKREAARANGAHGGRPSTAPTLHRDGTVTYWSVYQQVWVSHAASIPDDELAAMGSRRRARVMRHLGVE